MSFEPYQCLHVPVKAAQVRVFGLPLWLVWLAVAVVVAKVYGPWLFLAPVLVIAAAAGVVVAVAVLRSRPADPDTSEAGAGVPVDVLTGAPVVVLSGVGALPCMGCGTTPATAVLQVPGYRIPVCGPCQATATVRLAEMAATGTLPAVLRAMPRGRA